MLFIIETLIQQNIDSNPSDNNFGLSIKSMVEDTLEYLISDKVLNSAPAFTFNDQHRIKIRAW